MVGIIARDLIKPEAVGIAKTYIDFFQSFGETVIPIFPTSNVKGILEIITTLVLPGGPDVSPLRYDEPPGLFTSNPDINLEWADHFLVPEALRQGIPIIGICRGLQSLNVVLGGSLYQDLRAHPYSKTRNELVHSVSVAGKPPFKVNSLHHQCVTADRIAPSLVTVATYRDKDENLTIVEALKSDTYPIRAVQWHPEEWNEASAWTMEFFREVMK